MTQDTDNSNPSNGRILLAEDDHIGQLVTSRVLKNAAYVVDVVNNGLDAVRALESTDYDLVVMDCFMPVMDGFAATRTIRAASSTAINPNIPIIALTSLCMEGDREKCFAAGMNDYVSKPVDSKLLNAAIKRCLGSDSRAASRQQKAQGNPVWDDGFLDTIIDKFLEEVPLVVADLEQALDSGNVVALKDLGHRLRGPADLLKATTLSARAVKLETVAKEGDLVQTIRPALALITALQTFYSSLSDE